MMATVLTPSCSMPVSGGGEDEDSCQGDAGGPIYDQESTRSEWWAGAVGVPGRTFTASTLVFPALRTR
jgi:secreted trypsin-like serine protease